MTMTLPSSIPVDTKITFDDYKKMLFRQAELPMSSDRTVMRYAEVLMQVFSKAQTEFEGLRYDTSFILYSRCFHIFDQAIKGKRDQLDKGSPYTYKTITETVTKALDALDALRESDTKLKLLHSQLMQEVEEQQEQRQRLLALQMEEEEMHQPSQSELEEEAEARAHAERRQRLLEEEERKFGVNATGEGYVPPPPQVSVPSEDTTEESYEMKRQLLRDQEEARLRDFQSALVAASDVSPPPPRPEPQLLPEPVHITPPVQPAVPVMPETPPMYVPATPPAPPVTDLPSPISPPPPSAPSAAETESEAYERRRQALQEQEEARLRNFQSALSTAAEVSPAPAPPPPPPPQPTAPSVTEAVVVPTPVPEPTVAPAPPPPPPPAYPPAIVEAQPPSSTVAATAGAPSPPMPPTTQISPVVHPQGSSPKSVQPQQVTPEAKPQPPAAPAPSPSMVLLTTASEGFKRAHASELSKDYPEALRLYGDGLIGLKQAVVAEPDAARKERINQKIAQIEAKSNDISSYLAARRRQQQQQMLQKQQQQLASAVPVSPVPKATTPVGSVRQPPAQCPGVGPTGSSPAQRPVAQKTPPQRPQNEFKKLLGPPQNVIQTRTRQWSFNIPGAAPGVPRRGLVNLGNTCYINSVLQCLSVTPLGLYFRTDDYIDSVVDRYTGGGKIANTFTYVMRELNQPVSIPVSASHMKKALAASNDMFAGFSQQDANEFLNTLLDLLHEDLNHNSKSNFRSEEIDNTKGTDSEIATKYWNQYKARNDSIVVNQLAFQERSVVRCLSCNSTSRSFIPTMSIMVPIPPLSRPVSIEDCLAAYVQEELLDADTLYSCGKCNRKSRATKQLSFYESPNVLIVTLKRFKAYGNYSNKVNTPVMFQQILDFAPYMSGRRDATRNSDATYQLMGVVNHQGNMHGGHYTADAKSPDDRVWFSFSDEVFKQHQGTANNQLAYILVYARV